MTERAGNDRESAGMTERVGNDSGCAVVTIWRYGEDKGAWKRNNTKVVFRLLKGR